MLQPVDPNERFRLRRRQARRRRAIQRAVALGVLVVAAAGVALGARFVTAAEREQASPAVTDADKQTSKPAPKAPELRPLPVEMRGVHVTMALMSIPGKFEEYLGLTKYGLNTLQIDMKDENGEVAFRSPYTPLANRIGAARDYYEPREVVEKARARGIYLIARVVVFEDPFLSVKRPEMAIHTRDGSVWKNHAGLGWTNQYDKRVWDYNVDIAEAAARAGFDEVMFDYVRFPSDGDVENAVYPGKRPEKKTITIARFVQYARKRLKPLGVRVSAALFGLAATRDLGIGQKPRRLARYLDAIYPMVYPSHYSPGEYNIDDPNASPGQTVAASLRDFRREMKGRKAKLIPWLQDFSLGRTYTLQDIQLQIDAARRARAAGFLLWNAAGIYTPEALAGD